MFKSLHPHERNSRNGNPLRLLFLPFLANNDKILLIYSDSPLIPRDPAKLPAGGSVNRINPINRKNGHENGHVYSL